MMMYDDWLKEPKIWKLNSILQIWKLEKIMSEKILRIMTRRGISNSRVCNDVQEKGE